MRLLVFKIITLTVLCASSIRVGNAAPSSLDSQVDAILQTMTLEQRVGQLFMVSGYGEELSSTGQNFLQKMMPGAVAMFSYNGSSPQAINQTINAWQTQAIQTGARVPLLVSIDYEGGTVVRMTSGFTPLPWGPALGAMPVADAHAVGKIAGEELSAVGFNMNLAPVVDVRTIPNNSFMEPRMFGNDPARVGAAADAYIQGMNESGVIGVLKHFPGHGAAGDSHVQLPVVNYDANHVNSVELVPFRDAIENGAEAVMVGHLDYPALDPTPDMPAFLSEVIVGDVLRKQLNFNGVAMTDAMDMEAIVNHYKRPVAAVVAIHAGIDMIAAGPHTPITDQLAMKQAVIDAVNQGKLSASRIEEAARRILLLKAKHSLLTWIPLDPAGAKQRIDLEEHQATVDDIYLRTVAIADDPNKLLPLAASTHKVAIIYPGVFPSIQRGCSAIDSTLSGFAYTLSPSVDQIASAHTLGAASDFVVIFTYNISDYPGQAALVNSVPADKTIVVALQSPYDLEQNIHPAAYLTSFNPMPGAFVADCAILYGKRLAQGVWHN